MPFTLTRAPRAMVSTATAFQCSPRTMIWPAGAKSSRAVPKSPTIPPAPRTTLLRRARTANVTSIAVRIASGAATPIAVATAITP